MGFLLDPDAVLDFQFDWTSWLAEGETISSHAVTVSEGVTKDSDSRANGVVTVWLSGGVLGREVTVTCHVVTDAGRQDERSLHIRVQDR